MSDRKQEMLERMEQLVLDMEEEEIVEAAKEYLSEGFDPYDGIEKGLAEGMSRAGKLFEEGEYYIPELLLCSDAMYAGLELLKPEVLKHIETENSHRAVVGVVQGDTHDIGKNLFKIMLETAGFEVLDLGSNVSPSEFLDKAREFDADLVGLSTLMTTTMGNMAETVGLLKKSDLKVKVMVGGGPISQEFADKIGADGFAKDVNKAAKMARQLVENKKQA